MGSSARRSSARTASPSDAEPTGRERHSGRVELAAIETARRLAGRLERREGAPRRPASAFSPGRAVQGWKTAEYSACPQHREVANLLKEPRETRGVLVVVSRMVHDLILRHARLQHGRLRSMVMVRSRPQHCCRLDANVPGGVSQGRGCLFWRYCMGGTRIQPTAHKN